MISPIKLVPVLAPFVGGAAVMAWRYRETRTPSTVRKIIIPPLGMSTGLMQRSNGFVLILLGLFAVRIALHDYIAHLLPPAQTASVFFLLAFGMILRWRVGMYLRFRKLIGTAPA